MRKIAGLVIIALFAWVSLLGRVEAADWPQFRGLNSSGRASGDDPLPAKIDPKTNVIWKSMLPPGHSSPVVVGDRIYLTAVRDKQLLTMGLNRENGRVLWTAEAPARTLEKVHRIGSLVQPTPAADSECVVSFFGSSGLFCYDKDGKSLWNRPLGPFKNDFGAGSSPVLVGDRVILSQDHDQGSFLLALDRKTGKTHWETDRSEFLRGYCTPVIWEVGKQKQIVVAGTLRVAGYDLENGKELWTVRGISRTVCATPVVGEDNILYLAGWAAGGDPGAAIEVEAFAPVIKELDKNVNGTLEKTELKRRPMAERFSQVDVNKDGSVTREEYEHFRGLFQQGRNLVLAVRPGGKGDATETHVVWKNNKQVPFCASPLQHAGLVYTLKDGGLFASLDARDGKMLKYERLPNTGNYYSSPVVGDGKIYLLNERGRLTVVKAGREWEVLFQGDFGEDVYATPALVDGRIYLRTTGHLYCFGLKKKEPGMTMNREQASGFARLALKGIRKEYPNKPGDVLNGEADVKSPKAMHPAFYGCFDWHSSVHGHWMLVRLLKLFPDLSEQKEIRAALNDNLTEKNLRVEADYFRQPNRKSFERPYGWAWLLKLAEELHDWEDADGKEWSKNLGHLTETIATLYIEFLPKQTYPIRTGVHPNTAFGLAFALDYARTAGHEKLRELVSERARTYFGKDENVPASWEPGGADFFSPSLLEADLMRRVLSEKEFRDWFRRFLPDLAKGEPKTLLSPAKVTDRTDPQIVHLDGLNLSRAWCMRSIAAALPKDEPVHKVLSESAKQHAEAALGHVASGDYAGEHWLASFAVYLFSTR